MSIVLDASAVLALLNGEAGAEQVEDIIDTAALSTVNLAEVLTKLVEKGLSDTEVQIVAAGLPCAIIPFDMAHALTTGVLRRDTQPKGLSLGDRACLATAQRLSAAVMTTDRAWKDIDVGVTIDLIR